MTIGIGIDIIEIARIARAYSRFGNRFLERILRPEEISYCLRFTDRAPIIAARFAAKEAVAKALGARIGQRIGWLDIQITHAPNGAPAVVLHGNARDTFNAHGAKRINVSISHSRHYAVAVATIET
ncbi:MAG: holo-ACP synthase [Verrucomicrobiae bacterium]|nr:holo-ACP synthase [Verrucomicrobiae bacterium]